MIGEWKYDVPTGTWRNEELSVDVLRRAARMARCIVRRWNAFGTKRRGDAITVSVCEYSPLDEAAQSSIVDVRDVSIKVEEFGIAYTARVDDDRLFPLVEQLARMLPKIDGWIQLPELRRVDESCWVCSCGAEFALPSALERNDHGRALHLAEFPLHSTVFTLRIGRTIAWYGMGFRLPATADAPLMLQLLEDVKL